MIIIGPFDNKTTPKFCPDQWWKDYQEWLPKDWIAIVLGNNKFRIIPYYDNETEIFRGWDNDDEHEILTLLKLSGPLRSLEITGHLDKSKRTVIKIVNSLLEQGKIKTTRTSLGDPTGKYYIDDTERVKEND